MHVIRRGDDDTVDVLLLVEHLPVVAIALGFRQLDVHEAAEIGHVVHGRTALVGGDLRRGTPRLARGPAASGRPTGRWVQRCLVGVESLGRVGVVHVTDCDDVLAHEGAGVAAAHAADADNGNVHGVAGRLEASTEHVTRDDDDSGPGSRGGRNERTAGDACWAPAPAGVF